MLRTLPDKILSDTIKRFLFHCVVRSVYCGYKLLVLIYSNIFGGNCISRTKTMVQKTTAHVRGHPDEDTEELINDTIDAVIESLERFLFVSFWHCVENVFTEKIWRTKPNYIIDQLHVLVLLIPSICSLGISTVELSVYQIYCHVSFEQNVYAIRRMLAKWNGIPPEPIYITAVSIQVTSKYTKNLLTDNTPIHYKFFALT